MKNKFLLFSSLLVSSFTFAQTQPSFGVRAGISSTGIRGDASKNLDQLLNLSNGMVTTSDHNGFFVGVYSNIPLSESFSVEPGIYYSQKGYQLNGNFNVKGLDFLGTSAKAVLLSQYIDIPVLLKANFGGLQIFAGPQLSYLTKADLKTTAGVFGINLLNKTMDASAQFNKWDAGVTGGIGYQFSNGFNLMASYDYGLQKIDAGKSVNAFNRGIKLGVGVNF